MLQLAQILAQGGLCKPKGRFFRSVRLYLTEIVIDICYNWRKFWRKGAFAFGGIGRIELIRPIGHKLVDSLTRRLVDFPLGRWTKKRSGTLTSARPGWSYSIDMCYIKLIRALDQQLREPYQLHCFRT